MPVLSPGSMDVATACSAAENKQTLMTQANLNMINLELRAVQVGDGLLPEACRSRQDLL